MLEHVNSTRVEAPNTITPVISASSQRTCEDATLNSEERAASDDRREKRSTFISCKKLTSISTMNVRTLLKEGKMEELARNFINHRGDILGIIDHKLVHEEDILIKNLDKCTLITTSAWRNECNAAQGGVGILVTNKLKKLIADIKPHNERILQINISGNPETSIIINYAPVNGSEGAEEHYERLSAIINSIPKHIIIDLGDFNAHLGEGLAKHTYHKNTNRNGHLLHEHAQECDLHITNVMYKKRRGKLWTYISDMNGSKSQIDYILINKKWRNSVKDVEAYSNFSSLGSDHRILTAKIKLSLRMSRSQPRKTRYDWNALRCPELQNLYTVTVKNRYTELSVPDEEVTEEYGKFIQANKEATEKLIPQKKKRKRKNIATDARIKSARKDVEEAFSNYQTTPCAGNQSKLQLEKNKLTDVYVTVQEEELSEMIKKVEESNTKYRHGESWRLINDITGRKAAKRGIIKGSSKEERLKQWYKHFSELLGKKPLVPDEDHDEDLPPILNDLGINDGPFTMPELLKAKKSLCDGKAAGPDDLPPDVIRRCDFDEIILNFANKLLIDKLKPDQWSEIDLIPLPKSGDLSDTGNYRGIGLSSVVAKLINKMILLRIQPKVDPLLRRNQNGFRPGRSTVSHILALRRIIEGVQRNNRKAILIFIDFKKAFDSVHRGKMLQILKAYDIPPNLLNAIKVMHDNTKAKVITPDGETDHIDIVAGVLQGDTLAPYIFAIVLDFTMREAINGEEENLGFQLERRKSRRIPPVTVTDLDFADDIALVAQEIEAAQELLLRVEAKAGKVGLHLNTKKTEVQSYNFDTPLQIKCMSGRILKEVDNFKYLGAWTQSSEKDFQVRKALAWSACHKLKKIWTSQLSRKIKQRLFIATVESVLLYGAESWTITKVMKKQIDGCYTRMLRMALNISWKQKLTNKELYQELPPVTDKIRQRRMKLAGHCVRHKEEIACDLVLWEPTDGHTNRGRRRRNFIDNLLEDTGVDSTSEIRTLMMDRDQWRTRVKTDGRPRGRHR